MMVRFIFIEKTQIFFFENKSEKSQKGFLVVSRLEEKHSNKYNITYSKY
jgi:hypothetical protein